jgi:hypothetical protein
MRAVENLEFLRVLGCLFWFLAKKSNDKSYSLQIGLRSEAASGDFSQPLQRLLGEPLGGLWRERGQIEDAGNGQCRRRNAPVLRVFGSGKYPMMSSVQPMTRVVGQGESP